MSKTATLKESVLPQPSHQRHRPEKTLLYHIIDRYYTKFCAYMAEQGRSLPYHVQKEFDEYLKCGRLEHGFLRVQCSTCHHERLVAFSGKRRGFCPSCGTRRMADDCMDAGGRAKQEPEPKVQPCWWRRSPAASTHTPIIAMDGM